MKGKNPVLVDVYSCVSGRAIGGGSIGFVDQAVRAGFAASSPAVAIPASMICAGALFLCCGCIRIQDAITNCKNNNAGDQDSTVVTSQPTNASEPAHLLQSPSAIITTQPSSSASRNMGA